MSGLVKILFVIAVSTIKFLLAPAISFGLGLNFIQTLLSTTSGGIVGVLISFFLSRWIIAIYAKYFTYWLNLVRHKAYGFLNLGIPSFIPARKFTKRNRFIIKTVRKYGLAGIVFVTPILSIPLGTFVATRYYSSHKYLLLYLSGSVLFWSLFMSSAISLF